MAPSGVGPVRREARAGPQHHSARRWGELNLVKALSGQAPLGADLPAAPAGSFVQPHARGTAVRQRERYCLHPTVDRRRLSGRRVCWRWRFKPAISNGLRVPAAMNYVKPSSRPKCGLGRHRKVHREELWLENYANAADR
jgi:hypothetical protein